MAWFAINVSSFALCCGTKSKHIGYYLVIQWDESLSQLIGTSQSDKSSGSGGGAKVTTSGVNKEGSGEESADGGSDEEAQDEEEEDEDEPEAPSNELAVFENVSFKYNPQDPAGLRLGKLSSSDAARYHFLKEERIKAGKFEEWKDNLNAAVLHASSLLSTKTLTDARSKKAAKKILEDLQRYVCFTVILIKLMHLSNHSITLEYANVCNVRSVSQWHDSWCECGRSDHYVSPFIFWP